LNSLEYPSGEAGNYGETDNSVSPRRAAGLALIEASGWTSFPPRKPEQPIFYPVLNEEYAAWISKHWNIRDHGSGYVTSFAVDSEFVKRYPVQRVGSVIAQELWVPADELAEFNRMIVGGIEVIAEFHA
jgi:hypothetical protein